MDSPTARAGPPTMRVVGVMSGTSCDGIDVAVVDIGRTSEGAFQVATVGHRTLDWEAEHRAAILRIISEPSKPQSLKDLGRLDVSVARAFAAAGESHTPWESPKGARCIARHLPSPRR